MLKNQPFINPRLFVQIDDNKEIVLIIIHLNFNVL